MDRLRCPLQRKITVVESFLDGPAIPGNLRQLNRLTTLRLLHQSGPVTKPELARISGISRPTVAKVVDELEEEGLAERIGVTTPSASGGKPGALYRFNADGVRSGAIFFTVDTAHLAIVDAKARVLGKLELPLNTDRRPEPVIHLVTNAFQTLLASLQITANQLLGLGVGMPGLTSFRTGVVHFAPHFPQWHDVPLRARLQDQLGVDVWVDNDCHVRALAERHFGAGQTSSDFAIIESGIGISAAFYLQNMLYRGIGETAGEIGHMTIQEDGPLCECGNRGCWESLASTSWMVNQAYQQKSSHQLDWLVLPKRRREMGDKENTIEPQIINVVANSIFRAANAGQPEAINMVRQHATHFGIGVASLINTLNPQRIIIWGDSVAGGDLFLETVRMVVRQRALKRPRELCEIVLSSLPQDIGVIGAASLVIDALFHR